jgi:pre-rRNA-processing protein IPI3
MEITVIASSSIDEGIGSWDLKTGTEQLQFKPCASPAHGLTAVGEKFLASSQLSARNTSGSIFYWSWTKPQAEVKSYPVEPIKALAANNEGTYLVGGGISGDIYLWEVATGKLLKKWHGHYRSVTCLVFSGDDSLLVSGSQDGSIRVWSLIRLKLCVLSCLFFCKALSFILILCSLWLVRLFDDFQRQQGNTLYEHNFNEHTMSVTDIVIDYGGCNAVIISSSEDRTCKVWSLSRGKLLKNIIFPSVINALALDPGGCVFYAGARDSKIYIGAINATSEYGTQVLGSVSEKGKAITCLAYCADGNLLISGSEDGVVCVWDPKSLRHVRTLIHAKGSRKGPVNNIQIVRKTIVANSNKTQVSWKSRGALIPPPLEKYERPVEDTMDGIVTVDPPPFSDVPVYSSFLSADLIDEQVKELQQQGSAATEMEMERLKLEYKRSLQMNEQWQKNYENLLQVVMEEEQIGGTN